MNAYEVINLIPVNDVDNTRVKALAESIKENGWQGAPMLYSEAHGMLITGSHRRAALEMLEQDDDVDLYELGEVAENVDDIIDAWCEENDATIDDVPFDNLSELFAGTWVEQYKDEIEEFTA